MKEFLRAKIFALSQYLEMLLSLILGLVIVILAGKLLMDVFNPQYIFAGEDVFAYYLETAMNLAIGVELIKMLCMHSPGTVNCKTGCCIPFFRDTDTDRGICNCCAVCYKKISVYSTR